MFDACQNTNRNRHLKSQISICTQRDAHSTVTFHALPNLKSFFLQYSAAELDSKHIRKSHFYFCAHFNAWEFSTAAQIEYMLEKRAKKSIQWKSNRVYLLNQVSIDGNVYILNEFYEEKKPHTKTEWNGKFCCELMRTNGENR